MKKCACCGFETEDLKYYNKIEWLCELCAQTETSGYNPGLKYDTIVLMKTMCYLANAIIQSNNEIVKKII